MKRTFSLHQKRIKPSCFLSTTLFFVSFFLILLFLFPESSDAQWGRSNTSPFGYDFVDIRLQGRLFFPQKDPEEQEITLGPLVTRPGLGISNTYSDNITFWEESALEDFITRLFPALYFQLPYRSHRFEIEYLGDYSWHSSHSRYDAQNHQFAGRAELAFSKTFRVNIGSFFGILNTSTEDIPKPPTDPADVPEWEQQFNRRRGFHSYHNYIDSIFQKKRVGIQVRYFNSMSKFRSMSDKVDDSAIHNPSVRLSYNILPRTRLILKYGFAYLDGEGVLVQGRQTSTDSEEHRLYFGTDFTLLKKIRAEILGTYNWLEYKDEALGTSFWGIRSAIHYSPFKRLRFRLDFSRSSMPTFSFTGDRSALGAVYYIELNNSFSMEYDFSDRLFFWINLLYRNFRYAGSALPQKRIDDNYAGAIQVIYKIRYWLSVGLFGGHTWNNSTMDHESFKETRGQIYIQCAF